MEKLKHAYKCVYKELMAAEEYLEHSKEYKEVGDLNRANMLIDIAQKELMVTDGVLNFFISLQA